MRGDKPEVTTVEGLSIKKSSMGQTEAGGRPRGKGNFFKLLFSASESSGSLLKVLARVGVQDPHTF